MTDTDFLITLEHFEHGAAPLAHINTNTFRGNGGHYSNALCDLLSNPGFIQ